MRFSSPTQFMAQRKTTVDEAWAGDIIGLPLEAVLMEAANTPDSSTPEISAGKILRTMAMNTREFLLISSSIPKYIGSEEVER